MTLFRKYLANENGTIAIETALIIPLLIATGLGAADVSNYLLQNHKMESGLVSAGRYLALVQYPESMELGAKRLATTGRVDASGDAVLNNWAASDVTITYRVTDNDDDLYRGGNEIMTVKISSQIPYKGFGFLNGVTGGSTLKASYEERIVRGGT